jgi:hypothetical protein
VIGVRYRNPQSRKELLGDLKDKYGVAYQFDESVFNDHLSGIFAMPFLAPTTNPTLPKVREKKYFIIKIDFPKIM